MKIKKPKTKGRRCTQTQCGFFLKGGCKPCDTCKSSSFIIKTDCQRCLQCENVPNSLRWGDNENKESEIIAQPKQPEFVVGVPKELIKMIQGDVR